MENKEKNQESDERKDIKSEHVSTHHSPGIVLGIIAAIVIVGGISLLGAASIARHENRSFARPMMADIEGRGSRGIARGGMMRGNFEEAGTTGVLNAIDGNNLTVKDSSGTEFKIVVSNATSYVKANAIAKQSDMQVNNVITVAGSSNSQGQIVATSIRIW